MVAVAAAETLCEISADPGPGVANHNDVPSLSPPGVLQNRRVGGPVAGTGRNAVELGFQRVLTP